jgi:hypothetical protein
VTALVWFLVLHDGDGAEHLIRYRPATSVALPAETTSLQPTPPAATRRYRLSLALRELARQRERAGRRRPGRRDH